MHDLQDYSRFLCNVLLSQMTDLTSAMFNFSGTHCNLFASDEFVTI